MAEPSSPSSRATAVMRRRRWSAMDAAERATWLHRGLDDIFDPDLRESIGRIIDDVRLHGDDAVCRALAQHDHIALTPEQLRVPADEIAAATVSADVDAGIDDAIAHLRIHHSRLADQSLIAGLAAPFRVEGAAVKSNRWLPIPIAVRRHTRVEMT